MKIALVIASLGSGGAERALSLLANHWVARGDEVTLITIAASESDVYAVDPRVKRIALDLEVDAAGMRDALSNNIRRVRGLRHAIVDSGAGVVLSFEASTNVLAVIATAGLRLRLVLSERTDPYRHSIGVIWALLRRIAYPFADALVVQTAALMPWGRSVVLGRKSVRAIPNALRALHVDAAAGRAEPERTVAAVGRLQREKGHDVLIRAFALIAAEFPEWRLEIFGEGPERAALTSLAHEAGVAARVSLRGWVDAPEQALVRAGVFVMPSRYEGFPNALLEAMGVGLPVISTACGGADELIDDRASGHLVPAGDPGALAASMRELMADCALRARLGARARESAQRYLPGAVLPLWDDVLSVPCIRKSAPKSCSSSAR